MSPRICPDCGKALPPGLPVGMCPNCLLQLAVRPASADNPSSQSDPSELSAQTMSPPPGEKSGSLIGRYKLLEQIGEGGFGTVWLAEQQEPVRRKVALKIIKLGMDTREVIARFEAERQALALMDHPNIARVFDGGATDSGRPYFVMELVQGVRITDYCDALQLSTEARLKLLMEVCSAVQHAHQKGVIHRDLKPSNVLVTEQDGRAVPKVIDFGIAKATGQELTGKTLFTRFNQLIGTPAYMSPEQAGLGSLDVDTQSDIYSLGVLLYELLTGRTPFSDEQLLKAGLDQVLRTIREQDPPKPSTQLSTLSQADLLAVAQRRAAEPARLNRQVRGDLDWIVMKCLEKDRARRYETVNGLARDIERHLQNEPVVARSPSVLYRFQKAIRRNRLAFAAAMVVFASLAIGLGIAGRMYFRERAAVREQERLRQLAETNLQRARQAADRMLTQFAEELKDKPHLIGLSRKLLEDALEFHQGFLLQRPRDEEMRHALAKSEIRVGEIYQMLAQFEKSIEPRQHALALLEELAREHPAKPEFREERANLHAALAFSFFSRDDGPKCLDHTRKSAEMWEALQRDFPTVPRYTLECANAYVNLANAAADGGYLNPPEKATSDLIAQRLGEAEKAVAAYTTYRTRFPAAPEDRSLEAQIQHWYGAALDASGRLDEAERAYWKCHHLRTRLAQEQPDAAGAQVELAYIKQYLGDILYRARRPEQAVLLVQEAAALIQNVLEQYPEYGGRSKRAGDIYGLLGRQLMELHRTNEAETALRRSVEIYTRAIALLPTEPMNRYQLSESDYLLGELLQSTGRTNEAAQVFQGTVKRLDEMSRETPPPSAISWHQRDALKRITSVYQRLGYTNETAEWNRRLAEFEKQKSLSETNTSKP